MKDISIGDFSGDFRGTTLWWFNFRPGISKSHFLQHINGIDMDISVKKDEEEYEQGRLYEQFNLRSLAFQSKSCIVQHIVHLLRLKNTKIIYSNGKFWRARILILICFERNLLKINWICHMLYPSLTMHRFLAEIRSIRFSVVIIPLLQLRWHLWYVRSRRRNVFL